MCVCDNIFDEKSHELEPVRKKYALLEPLVSDYLGPTEKARKRAEVCQELRISPRTLRRYLKRFRSGKLSTLSRKLRKDKGKNRKFDPSLLARCRELLDENPWRSVPKLLELLRLEPEFHSSAGQISASTLYHRLVSDGVEFSKLRRPGGQEKVFRQFQANCVHHLWQSDARVGIFLPDPEKNNQMRRVKLFTFIDDYSRKVLYARYYFDETLPRLEDCFRQAILRWGIPKRLYVDNGSVYVSRRFLETCVKLEIHLIHHPPYQAWCKGKVERFMRTLKNDFQREAELAGMKTLEELNSALEAWLETVHHKRQNTETGETPSERFIAGLITHPPRRIRDILSFNRMFHWTQLRIVNAYGQVQVKGNIYRVPDTRPGTKVSVRFDPFDLSEVHLSNAQNGKDLGVAKAGKLTHRIYPALPAAKEKSAHKISQSARNYMTRLRENLIKERTRAIQERPFYHNLKEKQHDDKS